MKTKRHLIRSVGAGLLLSAALVVAAGTGIPAAEAGPRPEVRERAKTKKSAPRPKREVKPRQEKKASVQVRREPERRDDAGRSPQIRRDGDRRPDVGSHPERGHRDGRRGDGWNLRVERRGDQLHYVPRHWFPRFVRATAPHFVGRNHRPWYADARQIYIHDDPFYFRVGLGIYIGGIAVQFDLRNEPPRGYLYYDPYCDEVFWTLAEYRHHLSWYDHPPVLTLIVADGY
jgi:hypothetical protein